jgi:DnaK suppressor protein
VDIPFAGPDRTAARERLLTDRAAAEAQLAELAAGVAAIVAASEGANNDDEHDPEGSTIAFERAQTQALEEGMRRRLAEIDAALERVEDGRYGVCAVCGRPIGAERLEARPTADRCVHCAGRSRH